MVAEPSRVMTARSLGTALRTESHRSTVDRSSSSTRPTGSPPLVQQSLKPSLASGLPTRVDV
jgi:hypothetical protein